MKAELYGDSIKEVNYFIERMLRCLNKIQLIY